MNPGPTLRSFARFTGEKRCMTAFENSNKLICGGVVDGKPYSFLSMNHRWSGDGKT